ncbi:MAG: PDZ domain-containing protein, partial [Conchiformibius sp.]|nr:PDZ domain-containing protein [Conchiformibius sp.]
IGSFDVPAAGLQIAIGNGKDGQELIIRNVSGAAAASGLKRGDIIRQINGRTVGSEAELNEALKAGKNLPVLVQRGGNSVFIALVLP